MQLTDQELKVVSDLAQKQVRLEAQYEADEEALKQLKKRLDYVKQVELPNALAELGLMSVSLLDGAKIDVKPHYYASIPKERKGEAFSWLTDHKYDGIIKNTVKCDFGKGENDKATEAMQELISLGFQPVQDMNVHPMTLKSFVKDLFERGEDFPMELFGAGTVNEAKVVLPKKGK